MTETIKQEVPHFFECFPNLSAVYNELVTAQPRYPRAYPQALSHRQMFAGVVAFLLGDDWRPHMNEALASLRVESARNWMLAVNERLERASG
jgi:hypothetical protein